MWFGVLGEFEIQRGDGDVVTVRGPRARSLLVLLALEAGRVVTVDALIEGLYGDRPPGDALNALQSQISRLRRDLRGAAPHELVESHPTGYRLAVDPDRVDAHRFERLAAEGRRQLAAGDHVTASATLRQALDLWHGPAPAELGDAPTARAHAHRLEELRLAAVEDRAEAELALGGHRELVTELQQLVAAHPLRERPRGQLMRALYGCGRRADALGVYEDTRRILADELGNDPSEELAAVHLSVLRGDRSLTTTAAMPAPVPVSVPTPSEPPTVARNRPPAQLTSFVGRRDELERVSRLLGPLDQGGGARLLTVVGSGGSGKTRLAIEAAGREPGDVAFADLSGVGDGDDLTRQILNALGVREGVLNAGGRQSPFPDTVERLLAALSDTELLLVLDNCEHVVEEVARLVFRLLSSCPRVRVLATSREALGITGEVLCPVPPLAAPPEGVGVTEALEYPAVRLFADRAIAVRPDFQVDADTVVPVVRVCRALDGLPLAIELAAARLRSLPVDEVAARLDDRFRLLSQGSRTASPRHQTLRAVVGWSWDLLEEDEQRLARRLTVFAGGFTLAAAGRVCEMSDAEAVERLTGLADKSLIEGDGGRYRMLGTVRAFCAERLAQAGEEEHVHRRHTEYFLDLARTLEPALRTADQLDSLARLAAEHANLQAALHWAVRADQETALRLIADLTSYWWLRGLRGHGVPAATELLRKLGTEPPRGLEEEYVLCVLNAAAAGSGGTEEGQTLGPYWQRAEEIIAVLEWPPRYPFLTVLWGMGTGTPRPGAVADGPQRSDPWSDALARLGWGHMALFGGQVAEAERQFEASLSGFRSTGDRWGMTLCLAELATLAVWRGDGTRSMALYDEALALAGQLGAVEDLADLLCRKGDGLVLTGDYPAARTAYERAARTARDAGAPTRPAAVEWGLGEIARLSGDLPAARTLIEAALAGCATGWFAVEELRARVFVALGRIAEAEGDTARAREWHQRALDVMIGSGNLAGAAGAVEALAGVVLLENDPEGAAVLLGLGAGLRGVSLDQDPDVGRTVRGARESAPDYAVAYDLGRGMTGDEALAFLGRA
ncbi:BTAD domain-containing putative transcriptional regulator [Streptomyces sp. NPDC057638]|uniref:AfsR/SARP family transcriptional regulator n=1 Tax=Streptomyces sp. NPDC057638 TaxID=3346190 RepID=UPI0036BEB6D4